MKIAKTLKIRETVNITRGTAKNIRYLLSVIRYAKVLKGILLGIAMFLLLGINTTKAADFTGFLNQLKIMDIPVEQILGAKGVSRYDLARLLNTAECKDCIYPDSFFVKKYTSDYWSDFLLLPGKDFGDIKYQQAIWDTQSYFYCVAYVGENSYMRGYPVATSPLCAGLFCGSRTVTKAEFIQVIINLISKYIYNTLTLNWQEAKIWMNKLNKNDYIYKTLNADDIKTIQDNATNCKTDNCTLNNAGEVTTYLKYCMFNLDKCAMSEIGKIKQGFWPVAELNVLNRQNIITLTEAEKHDLDKIIDGQRILEILFNLYKITDCTFDNDYDCDGIFNKRDICGLVYNPTQKDSDHDGIPDVCDDDIDNDGILNPIGIVDDLGRFNVKVLEGWTGTLDNCLFVPNTDQVDANNNKIGDACEKGNNLSMYIAVDNFQGSAPITAKFQAITKGNRETISWDMGDGTKKSGPSITHTFIKPGMYIIKAEAKGKGTNDAIAKTVVIVGSSSKDQKALQIKADKIGGDPSLEIIFGDSSIGDADEIQRIWDTNINTTTQPNQSFKKIFNTPGSYSVGVKMIKNKHVVGVSNFVVGVGKGYLGNMMDVGNAFPGSMLKSNMLNPNMGVKVDFQTISYGFVPGDINYVDWNRGDGNKEQNNLLATSHTFQIRGPKVVIQTINLKNGLKLTNFITLYIVDPSLMASYAMQTDIDKLNPNAYQKINFNSSIKGDVIGNVITFLNNYEPGQTNKIDNTKFPIQSSYSYNLGNLYYPENTLYINECLYMQNQSTLAVAGEDICLKAYLDGSLKNFKCDLDQDGIPDICDDDIDGDGVKNLLGIIKYENETCITDQNISDTNNNVTNGALDKNNVDLNVLLKHWTCVCSLDNSPFFPNPDQMDLNTDCRGDAGNNGLQSLGQQIINNQTDMDGDGIPDLIDVCPDIKENFNNIQDIDGCPEIGQDLKCEGKALEDVILTPLIQPICNQCPCQFADITSNLANNDQLKAVLRDKQKKIPYKYSLPWIFDINQ